MFKDTKIEFFLTHLKFTKLCIVSTVTTFTDTSMLTHATVSARLASARLKFFLDSGGVGGFQSKFISKYLINNMVFFTYNFFSKHLCHASM